MGLPPAKSQLHQNENSALIFQRTFDVGDLIMIFYIVVQLNILFYSLATSLLEI